VSELSREEASPSRLRQVRRVQGPGSAGHEGSRKVNRHDPHRALEYAILQVVEDGVVVHGPVCISGICEFPGKSIHNLTATVTQHAL
jgi:hypothetical protein